MWAGWSWSEVPCGFDDEYDDFVWSRLAGRALGTVDIAKYGGGDIVGEWRVGIGQTEGEPGDGVNYRESNRQKGS